MNTQALVPLIIVVPLVVFWVWMAYEFTQNDRIPPNERFVWIFGFVFLGILTAGYYYFTVYRER